MSFLNYIFLYEFLSFYLNIIFFFVYKNIKNLFLLELSYSMYFLYVYFEKLNIIYLYYIKIQKHFHHH
jgi:hypothetical protein